MPLKLPSDIQNPNTVRILNRWAIDIERQLQEMKHYNAKSNLKLEPSQLAANIDPINLDTQVADGITHIRSTQFQGSALVLDNANFEASKFLPVPGWTLNFAVATYDLTNPHNGNQALKITTDTQFGGVVSSRTWKVLPGEVYRVQGYLRADAGAIATIGYNFTDANATFVGTVNNFTTNAGWTFVEARGIVPAGGIVGQLVLSCNTVGGGVCYFDDIACARLQTAFDVTPINTAGTPSTTTNPLSQSGTSTTINVASTTFQFGDGNVSFNSGSVNPGSFGTWYVYADDPALNGGAVTYAATSNPWVTNAANGRVYYGVITTTGGGGATGAGGGTGGGGPRSKSNLQ